MCDRCNFIPFFIQYSDIQSLCGTGYFIDHATNKIIWGSKQLNTHQWLGESNPIAFNFNLRPKFFLSFPIND